MLKDSFLTALFRTSATEIHRVSLLIISLFFFVFFLFNWDSLHARLNSHYEAWSDKKKKSTKKVTGYRKSV